MSDLTAINSNTTPVTVQRSWLQLQRRGYLIQIQYLLLFNDLGHHHKHPRLCYIQIQYLLLFNRGGHVGRLPQLQIQIQYLLLFNVRNRYAYLCRMIFKYNTCYCSTLSHNTVYIRVQIQIQHLLLFNQCTSHNGFCRSAIQIQHLLLFNQNGSEAQ